LDVFIEPGVWDRPEANAAQTVRWRCSRFDPFYLFASSALKPEPIDVKVKVVMIGDAYLFEMLYAVDETSRRFSRSRPISTR